MMSMETIRNPFGRRGLFAGQLSRFNGKWQLAHPEFELLPDGVDDDPLAVLAFAGALIPIYPASKAVASWQVRKAVDYSLSMPEADTRDPALRKMYGKRNAAVVSCLHALAERGGAEWTTFGHTDTQIQTTAFGLEAAQFAGANDNTDLCRYIRQLITS